VIEIQGRREAHSLWTGLQAEYARYRQAVSYIPITELRMQEDLRKYLCLRCAGFMEQLTYVAVSDFLARKSSGPTREFATSFFHAAPNLGVTPFIKLMARFGIGYEERFETFLTKNRRDALADLMSVRNEIAHGKNQGGRKLDPDRYVNLCRDIYDWYLGEFLEQIVVTTIMTAETTASDG
jgi:hypothetical protein